VPTADSAFKVGAPRRRLGRWPHGPARPSPHLPASASRSRCARSPDRLLRGGSRLPGVDVGPCEAGSPARHHPQHWDQPGSIDGIEHQTAGQGPSPCQNLPLSRSHQSFPGIEPGNDWPRVRPGTRCGGSSSLPRPGDDRSERCHRCRGTREAPRRASSPPRAPGSLIRSAPPDRYRNCPHPCTNSVRPTQMRPHGPFWRVSP
jgi:hypothetical protein